MKWAHRLLGLLVGALVVGVAFSLLLPAFQGGSVWLDYLAQISDRRHTAILVSLTAILGVVGFVLTGINSSPRAKYLAYETQYGNISISLKALQDFLGHLKLEFPTVLSLTPKVRVLDESLHVMLEIRVRSGAPIPEISRMLQERARILIQEKVGIADIHDVEVKVEEIVQEKSSEVSRQPPPAGEVP